MPSCDHNHTPPSAQPGAPFPGHFPPTHHQTPGHPIPRPPTTPWPNTTHAHSHNQHNHHNHTPNTHPWAPHPQHHTPAPITLPTPATFTPTPQSAPIHPHPSRQEREQSYTKAGYHPSTDVSLERVDPGGVVIGKWEGPAESPELHQLGLRGGHYRGSRDSGGFGGGPYMSGALGGGRGWEGDGEERWRRGEVEGGLEFWEGGAGGGGDHWGGGGEWSLGVGEPALWESWGGGDQGWWVGEVEGRGWESRTDSMSGEWEGSPGWDMEAWEGRRERRRAGRRRKRTLKRERKVGVWSSTVLVLTVDHGSRWMRECAAYYGDC
ncbi:hypothetical protein QBC39DRAFT_370867 [Podospora conica]|nr:hypothetical protein QBC39DRAFT_370867 [Schizothecium conicum]